MHCFRFFKILIFQIGSGVKGQKMAQNDKKLYVCQAQYFRKHNHMILIYGTHV